MKLEQAFYPSLLVSESFYPLLGREQELYQAVERMISDGYYQRIECGSLKTPEIRKKFIRLMESGGVGFTQWITNDINEKKLNPSTLDGQIREKTIREISALVDTAAESGADRVAMVSGPDPGEAGREEALKGIEEVLFAVTDRMKQYPGMILLLEPLDRGAHKNNLIGPTEDSVRLMERVNRDETRCLLSWDSAHMALNREDLEESIEKSSKYIGHIHLANAILDPTEEGYGDWHMAMGKPGFLDEDCGARILRKAAEVLDGVKMGVSIESRCQPGDDPFANEKKCREFLMNVLQRES
ncbi:MAG: sugar phosphate isomerase/epimerase [Lachnospiraceae bacterium]|nr:sugar phosphate isomerase/epimerase [Lachnospiraceae bacterium]